MSKIKDNYTAEIIITLVVLTMLLTSCSFNNKAEAMPPVHTLYHGLSVNEKSIYNSLNAEERANVNKNTEMYQLRQALDTTQYEYDY
jgi:hypothetical protein